MASNIPYRHIWSSDGRKCLTCGQKRPRSTRKFDVVAMTLVPGWRLIARPLSWRVQRLQMTHYSRGNPIWIDIQRMPRTRNEWRDEEQRAAVGMLHRRFNEALATNTATFASPNQYRGRCQTFSTIFDDLKNHITLWWHGIKLAIIYRSPSLVKPSAYSYTPHNREYSLRGLANYRTRKGLGERYKVEREVMPGYWQWVATFRTTKQAYLYIGIPYDKCR